jgi:hypothetical protein
MMDIPGQQSEYRCFTESGTTISPAETELRNPGNIGATPTIPAMQALQLTPFEYQYMEFGLPSY